jgi:hypothetical protein
MIKHHSKKLYLLNIFFIFQNFDFYRIWNDFFTFLPLEYQFLVISHFYLKYFSSPIIFFLIAKAISISFCLFITLFSSFHPISYFIFFLLLRIQFFYLTLSFKFIYFTIYYFFNYFLLHFAIPFLILFDP